VIILYYVQFLFWPVVRSAWRNNISPATSWQADKTANKTRTKELNRRNAYAALMAVTSGRGFIGHQAFRPEGLAITLKRRGPMRLVHWYPSGYR